MKTIITTNPNTPTGYELRVVHDDGIVEVTPIEKITHDGKSLILPENPANRHFWALSRLDGKDVELSYKESKTFGPRDPNATPKTTTSKWAEYLTEDEKKIYEELVAKAQRRMKAEQLKAQIAALEAQLSEAQA